MADKEKRLRKLLAKSALKGQLKSVATLEEARIVLIILDIQSLSKFHFVSKDTYLKMIERGYTFPEENFYYLVSTNPRNSKRIEERYLTNAFAFVKPVPKT